MERAEATPPTDELHLGAWNGALWDLGLRWQWDAGTLNALTQGDERAKLAAYIDKHQPHLLRAYDRDFLIDLILLGKERRRTALCDAATRGVRPDLSCNGLRAAWGTA